MASLVEFEVNPNMQLSENYIRTLYPAVNEKETPLPRCWIFKERCNFLVLTNKNLRVTYKGLGKSHKDAASVRANESIPPACGIYYFEVKVISKGRDGYMGIGLSTDDVSLNRLPGWDKNSFGYHGDDGHSFCSSGSGKSYGPTFTTGDVIGCCLNLIDNTCFYTKNGINLGIAFRNLPKKLFPTIGMQTPGESIDGNFGQSQFVFGVEDYIREWKDKFKAIIRNFPVNGNKGELQALINKIVLSYLVHYGHSGTAELLARSTGEALQEDPESIRNRQKVQKLLLSGRISEAIETTQRLYPGLLQRNSNLLFVLRCRQFIEMINGTDVDPRQTQSQSTSRSPRSHSSSLVSSPNRSPLHLSRTSPRASSGGRNSPASRCSKGHPLSHGNGTSGNGSRNGTVGTHSNQQRPMNSSNVDFQMNCQNQTAGGSLKYNTTTEEDGEERTMSQQQRIEDVVIEDGSDMQVDGYVANGNSNGSNSNAASNGSCYVSATNGVVHHVNGSADVSALSVATENLEDQMEIDEHHAQSSSSFSSSSAANGTTSWRQPLSQPSNSNSPAAVERLIHFGRELYQLSEQLQQEHGNNDTNNKILKDAFSLLAYTDPWNSPVGQQLDPVQREPICAALNGAILELNGHPKQPSLELIIGQASQCVKLMSKSGISAAAFVTNVTADNSDL